VHCNIFLGSAHEVHFQAFRVEDWGGGLGLVHARIVYCRRGALHLHIRILRVMVKDRIQAWNCPAA
jgi:hypothetical protein